MKTTLAWRCTTAAYAGAISAMLGHVDQARGVGWMLAALVLLCISIYNAEKYEQVKHASR